MGAGLPKEDQVHLSYRGSSRFGVSSQVRLGFMECEVCVRENPGGELEGSKIL